MDMVQNITFNLVLSILLLNGLVSENSDLVSKEKKTIVLIHGSWHSAWNWYKVKPLLESKGFNVIAPDLPSMGKDKTPVDQVRFESTIKILSEMIDRVEGKVILVGHSKNGVLISQLAELRPEKIEKLVYLAAVLAKNGKSAVDYFKLDQGEVLGPYITYDSTTNSSILSPEIYQDGLYHDCDTEITEMAKIILSNEPRETAVYTISISEENYGRIPRYYIECTEDRAITPALQQKMYNEMPCAEVFKIKSSHSPFFSKPEELVEILLQISDN